MRYLRSIRSTHASRIRVVFCYLLLLSWTESAVGREYRGEGPPSSEPQSMALLPKRSCYLVRYVPARVPVNTRGKLIDPERRVRDKRSGGLRRIPASYFRTETLIEPDHYTLIPTRCRG